MKKAMGKLGTIMVIMIAIFLFAFFADISFAAGDYQAEKDLDAYEEEALNDDDIDAILASQGIIPISASVDNSIDLESKYTLGTDDVIEIIVVRHPEVSGTYTLNAEGKIQYEFVGDVVVAGLKKHEVAEHLKEILSQYIISPEINVKIAQYNSKIVYVIGEVGAPGKIYMRGDTMTVREALVQAGLPRLTAKTAKSRLITPSASGKPKRKMVNVHKLLYEGDLRENLVMKPGDTLYVPPTIMTKAFRAIQPVSQPVGSAAGTTRQVTTGF